MGKKEKGKARKKSYVNMKESYAKCQVSLRSCRGKWREKKWGEGGGENCANRYLRDLPVVDLSWICFHSTWQ